MALGILKFKSRQVYGDCVHLGREILIHCQPLPKLHSLSEASKNSDLNAHFVYLCFPLYNRYTHILFFFIHLDYTFEKMVMHFRNKLLYFLLH